MAADWLELLSQTDGFQVGDWSFLGARIRSLVLPEGNYQVLAESSQESPCLKEGQSEAILHHLDQIDDQTRQFDVVDALLRILESRSD